MPKITLQVEGATVSEKRTVNFVAGENIDITATDDGDSVNIEIATES